MARVMLVDDDPAGLEIRKLILGRAGHTVFPAPSAEKARTLARMLEAEVAVLDLRLPDVEDGLALIRDLRTSSPALRIIALLGWAADLDGRPEAAMVEQILEKPVRSERLLKAISGEKSSDDFG